jgi:hypothetical protein
MTPDADSLDLPQYLVKLLQRPAPLGCGVVPGSTPVVSFGNARTATAATLGLNPSFKEFGNNSDERFDWLADNKRRLTTCASIGLNRDEPWPHAVDEERIRTVVKGCDEYFSGNPYLAWFRVLEETLNASGFSYLGPNTSACHLDLSPWATNPTWSNLTPKQRSLLVEDGTPILRRQLRSEGIRLILINGVTATRAVSKVFGAEFEQRDHLVVPSRPRAATTRLAVGELDGVMSIAWSVNLQSSFGVTAELRQMLGARVAELASSG